MQAVRRLERRVGQIACAELEAKLDQLLEGELSDKETGDCEYHISRCGSCRELRDDLLELSGVASTLLSTPVPESIRMRLRKRLAEETGVKFAAAKPTLSLVK